MKYSQSDLLSLSSEEVNNLRGKKFHITFKKSKIFMPQDDERNDVVCIICNTTSSGFSKPRELLDGFIIKETESNVENSISFSNIENMELLV